ncbi:DNA-binding protein [Saccharibacillus sp. JS10]|uniref:DNA-binding protein n=1 Tax=Saccharibacillus sp. JS10 TaxID=2950552 RepID=UPI00210B1122|nr:DNA-binding protein [Saccharibacillus sp. JS10]MCQ4088075.1 DNA-binding protein [Saccharibacillus sp. JS10]
MQTTMTLRSEIEKGIADLGMNFSSFGELSGINRGIFSAILNGNPPKPISLNQMEAITRAFGYPEGWMFDLYIEECFYDGKPNRRRVEPFLIRCAELHRMDCIQEVLSRLLEDLKHVSMIFDIAETLFLSGHVQESLVFYECVVENEKYHHSERLAISHYRLFRASIGEDNEQNLRAALRFEPFCGKLPDHHRLDGLLQLTNIYFNLGRWKEVEFYADELRIFANHIYQDQIQNKKTKIKDYLQTDRHLVVYYGQGYLQKGNALEHQGKYDAAMEYIEGYSDLSWFENLDDVGKVEVEKFKDWATANRLNLALLKGDFSVLEEYSSFLEKHPHELLPSVLTILESANKNNFKIEEILTKFLPMITEDNDDNYYSSSFVANRQANLYYQLALYNFRNKKKKNTIEFTLQALDLSIKLNNRIVSMNSIALFEEMRSEAQVEQIKSYENLIRTVYLNA